MDVLDQVRSVVPQMEWVHCSTERDAREYHQNLFAEDEHLLQEETEKEDSVAEEVDDEDLLDEMDF